MPITHLFNSTLLFAETWNSAASTLVEPRCKPYIHNRSMRTWHPLFQVVLRSGSIARRKKKVLFLWQLGRKHHGFYFLRIFRPHSSDTLRDRWFMHVMRRTQNKPVVERWCNMVQSRPSAISVAGKKIVWK